MMIRQFIDYPKLIEHSMRIVVKKALICLLENDYEIGDHHFYISFLTRAHGVVLSERMSKKYPHEMTIVLQHQFEELEVKEDYFTVKISFAGIKEKVKVPFSAITSFADPSVEFALQFTEIYNENGFSYNFDFDDTQIGKEEKKILVEEKAKSNDYEKASNVIRMDKFVVKKS
jgi:hypothetical protein